MTKLNSLEAAAAVRRYAVLKGMFQTIYVEFSVYLKDMLPLHNVS
jgi:hypothetical protein